jgi:UDP-glucose 4-epimerase
MKMETKTIVVTGGAGFIGSWLVDELIKRGHNVISVDDLSGGHKRNINKDCTFVKIDLRNKVKVNTVVKNTDMIFHLAAYAAEGQSFFSPIAINDINIKPMNNLLVAAVNNNVDRFVFTSSMAVYGEQSPPFSEEMQRKPVDPYGAGKAYCETMLEIFAKTYGFKYVIIRPHNVYGQRQNIADPYRNVLGIWMNGILRNKPPIIYGDGEQTRAFSYIEDVAPAIANAGFFDATNSQMINVGSEEVISVKKACSIVLEAMGSDLKPIHMEDRPGEVKHAYCTVEKSMKLLNYKTRHSIKEGVARMAEWAKQIGPQEPTYVLPLEITKRVPKAWLKRLI